MANVNYTGLPELPGPDRSEPGADAQGNLVGPNTAPNPMPRPEPQPIFKPRPTKPEFEQQQPSKPKRKFRGPSIGCRTISMLFSLAVILFIVFVIYLLVYRPANLWTPIKNWLNQDLQAVNYTQADEQQTLDELLIQTQSFRVGENELYITEDAVNILVNRELNEENRIFLDVEPGTLKVFADVDSHDPELPLEERVPFWVVAEFTVDPENRAGLLIEGVGTERIKTPSFLNEFLLDLILSTGNALTRSEATSILELIVVLPDNARITGVRLEDDQMVLIIELTSGLESLFQ